MGDVAIITPAITQWVAETRELLTEINAHETRCATLSKSLDEAQQAHRAMMFNVGEKLNAVRARMPKRDNAGNGWMAFLEAVELDPAKAWKYMQYAERVPAYFTAPKNKEAQATGRMPTLFDVDLDKRGVGDRPDTPAPTDEDAPREADTAATDTEDGDIDRDTWCTPKWIAEALGDVDLDPCTNERSHIQADHSFDLELRGEDGLASAPGVGKNWRVFINPPYSDVTPWIEAYAHTRFCFLLKLDVSTKWFERLIGMSELILLPKRTRVQFEPPPGIDPNDAKAQPFPHALFFAKAEDAPQALLDRCYSWRVEHFNQ